jgi:hypothetical protein
MASSISLALGAFDYRLCLTISCIVLQMAEAKLKAAPHRLPGFALKSEQGSSSSSTEDGAIL